MSDKKPRTIQIKVLSKGFIVTGLLQDVACESHKRLHEVIDEYLEQLKIADGDANRSDFRD